MCGPLVRAIVGIALVLSVAFLVGGCPVPVPSGYAERSRENLGVEVNDLLREGVSTREDVLLLLGEPDHVASDDSWLAYRSAYSQGGVVFVLCAQSGCAGAGGENMEYQRLIVTFDDSGVLTKAEFVSRDCWEGMSGTVGSGGGSEYRSPPCLRDNVSPSQRTTLHFERITVPEDLLDFANGEAELATPNLFSNVFETYVGIYNAFGGSFIMDGYEKRKELHGGEQWEALARATLSNDSGYDLDWYYLGRAAEGMALCDAADIYYGNSKEISQNEFHNYFKCAIHYSCAGLKFPEALTQRLSAIESMRIAGECRVPAGTLDTEFSSTIESTDNL